MRLKAIAVVMTGLLVASALALVTGGAGAQNTRPDAPNAGSDRSASPRRGVERPIRFVVKQRFSPGEVAVVRIENVGSRTYRYQARYPACYNVSFFDSSGREFLIPPGTHCDLIVTAQIEPGETKKLFRWKLDECVEDQWGCLKSEPLPAGTYRLEGRFKSERGGVVAKPTAKIQVLGA